jgi:hypothetical protein
MEILGPTKDFFYVFQRVQRSTAIRKTNSWTRCDVAHSGWYSVLMVRYSGGNFISPIVGAGGREAPLTLL